MKIYEEVSQHYLTPKLPLIVRVDGRSFSSVKSQFLSDTSIKNGGQYFREALKYACRRMLEEIPGASIGFVHGDEINILIVNYTKEETQPWFNNRIDKITSTSASLATAFFNKYMVDSFGGEWIPGGYATFDSRVFVLPLHEVFPYFKHRQLEGRKNCLLAFARQNLEGSIENKDLKSLIQTLKSNGYDFYSLHPEDILGSVFIVDRKMKDNGFDKLSAFDHRAIILDENEDMIRDKVYSGVSS